MTENITDRELSSSPEPVTITIPARDAGRLYVLAMQEARDQYIQARRLADGTAPEMPREPERLARGAYGMGKRAEDAIKSLAPFLSPDAFGDGVLPGFVSQTLGFVDSNGKEAAAAMRKAGIDVPGTSAAGRESP